MAGSILARRIHVSGVVQGVGYRYWTRRAATELGLTGWVRNLRDGRVQIHAEGPVERLDALADQCRRGPRSAHVSSVVAEACDPEQHPDFTQRPTADE